MLSVLIPIYNFNTTELVASIHQQLKLGSIEFEIICVCDASTKFNLENETIKKFSNTELISLKKNIGRSKIRNLLVAKSNYDWLLFLDADVFPKKDLFVKRYLDCISNNGEKVFCGGIIYKTEKPDNNKMLRWVYGKNREEISVNIRSERPYQYVSGANFLINKSIFEFIKFNEEIIEYGYEDVLFIEDLKNSNIEISHLENPVFHLGIESNLVFLNKTKEGVENLLYISSNNILKGDNLKLLKTFEILKKCNLNLVFSKVFLIFQKSIEQNLLSKKPSLFLFDIFKLGYLCGIDRKKN
jgi:glycosyltransferase involved in cell wall biosynthesis